MRASEFIKEEQQLNEFAFLPLLIPALATAVRVGAPYIGRALMGTAKVAAKQVAKRPVTATAADQLANDGALTNWYVGPLANKAKEVATEKLVPDALKDLPNTISDKKAALEATVDSVWKDVGEAYDKIAAMVGENLNSDTIKALADAAVEYAIPVAAVVAILYGGKVLYDYMHSSSEQPQPA